jgi:mannose-6-phosphate isomerase-like protein (cupin superfamily)
LPEQKHKITNIGDEDLVMFATCSPSYTDEDQIIMFDSAPGEAAGAGGAGR